jgi:alkaline phosphatase
MIRRIMIVAVLCVATVCFAADVPKNIVLMVGDGMGSSHLTAGRVVSGSLSIERLNVGGMVATHSSDKLVTDSAAAATAMATGKKTNNGMLSQSPDGKPFKTLFEYAKENKKSRGVAVTCSVTHATPAAFAAHVASRKMAPEIAKQMAEAELEVMFGGGLGYFMPKGMKDSKRKDERNLIDLLAKRGEVVVQEKHFSGLAEDKPASALIAIDHPASSEKRELPLSVMTAKALSILSSDKDGFVLVVEGSQIDWRAHANDEEGVIRETIEFDKAVGVVMDFASKNGETLVVVTADHETGAMSLLDGSIADKTVSKIEFESHGHSGEMVPLFAFGPGAAVFGGIKDNTFIGKTLIEYVRGAESK